MKIINLFIRVFLGVTILPNAYAIDWQTLTEQVVESDPRILSVRAKIKASDADIDAAWAAYFPTIKGIGSAGILSSSDRLTRDGDKRTIGLEIEQPIPIFGHEGAEVDAAKAAAQVEAAGLKETEQTVVIEFLEAVLRLSNAERIWLMHQELSQLLSDQCQALQEAVAGGGAPLPQLKLAQSRHLQAKAKQQQAKSDVLFFQTRLMRLLPDKKLPDLKLGSDLLGLINEIPEDFEQSLAFAMQASPSVLKAKAGLAQAKADKDKSDADYWPKLTLNLQGQTGRFGQSSASSTGAFINITQPIFEGGRTVAKADSAGYRVVAATESIRQEKLMLKERMQDIWTRWNNQKQSVVFWQNAASTEEESVNLTRQQVDGGVGTRISLMDALEDWVETRTQLLEQTLERDLAGLHLFIEMGGFARHMNEASNS